MPMMSKPFTIDSRLWEPQRRSVEQVIDHLKNCRDVCLQSPTGSGKTRMAAEIMRWGEKFTGGACFYTNRKALITQTKRAFEDLGMRVGVRAADHEEGFDSMEPLQICSADTERHRVYGDKATWTKHLSGVIVVDEAHIQKGDTMRQIMDDHRSDGANVVLLSATPVGLSSMVDELVVGGTMAEYRACGALVPAVVKSIEEPDMRKVKRTQSGEYVMNGIEKKVYTQAIVGNVIGEYLNQNPDGRPTMLYAPGKAESVWFTEKFMQQGIPWVHVDATDCVLDGKRRILNRNLWDEILGRYKDGSIKGISSRFKLREGIDVPSTYHVILATPIGSLQSYLQTVGRALRTAPNKTHALITDHGGCYLRHGSPNHDRPWDQIFHMSNGVASKLHQNQIRNEEIVEPICCPKCRGERMAGMTCPFCGHTHEKSMRRVIQESGRIVEVEGPMTAKPRRKNRNDTQTQWNNLYYGYKNKRINKTFSQMEAFFFKIHRYWPERNLDNQPLSQVHWHSYPKSVPLNMLRKKEQT